MMRLKQVALGIAFTALYASLVIALAPISFGPIQLRIADCLIPLTLLFGWPAIAGVSIGCFIGNAYFWLGAFDVFLGPLANLLSALIIFGLRRRPILAGILGALPLGVIVGGYLWVFFPAPPVLGLASWAAMIISLTLSSLIVLLGLGLPLAESLKKIGVVDYYYASD